MSRVLVSVPLRGHWAVYRSYIVIIYVFGEVEKWIVQRNRFCW